MSSPLPIRHMPLDAPPSRQMPTFGPRRDASAMEVEYVSSCDLEVNVELPRHCLSVNLRGAEGEVALGGDRFGRLSVPPAGIVFYPAGTPLKVVSKDSGPYVMVMLDPGSFADMVLEGLGVGDVSPYPVLGRCDPAARAIAVVVRDALLDPSPPAALVRSGATLLALHAARAMALPVRRTAAAACGIDVRQAIDYVEANVATGDLGCRALARVLEVPADVLHAAFRAALGMTPAQYVFQRRVAWASACIDGGATLVEAAARSGIGDAARLGQILRVRGLVREDGSFPVV